MHHRFLRCPPSIRRLHFAINLFVTLLLCACAAQNPNITINEPLTPAHIVKDPDDQALDQSVRQALAAMKAPLYSGYEFRRIDLNKDGRRDALVLFKTPYGYWCGTHGCTMLIMQAHNEHFSLVNAIQPVRAPIYSTDSETNGWRDIIIRVSGRWDDAKDVAAKYDGRSYPFNPAKIEPSSGEDIQSRAYLFQ